METTVVIGSAVLSRGARRRSSRPSGRHHGRSCAPANDALTRGAVRSRCRSRTTSPPDTNLVPRFCRRGLSPHQAGRTRRTRPVGSGFPRRRGRSFVAQGGAAARHATLHTGRRNNLGTVTSRSSSAGRDEHDDPRERAPITILDTRHHHHRAVVASPSAINGPAPPSRHGQQGVGAAQELSHTFPGDVACCSSGRAAEADF